MLENNEIWKDIKGYEGRYQVSNKGRVWSIVSQKYLKPLNNSNSGYLVVNLYAKNGKTKRELIHRLVALMFIDNPNNFPQVGHQDDNKNNNDASNLYWTDAKENCNHGKHFENLSKARGKQVRCIETGEIYHSAREAARQLNICRSSISATCRGELKTAGTLHWQYI